MKNFFFLLSLFLIAFQVFAGSDWSPPSPNATIDGKLTVNSTSKASRPYPSMTTAQRDAVTATEGETIFNSTTGKLNIYSGAKWGEVSGSGGGSGGIDFLTGQNFDSGVSAWTGSGTFTATTTALGAGAYWSITGTGTRELVVNTSSYSGSQVWASIYVNSTDTNLSFCVVTTYENCAKNTSEAGWKKLQVQFTATTTATIKLKSLSSSFAGYFAAVKIEPWTPQYVQTATGTSVIAAWQDGTEWTSYTPTFSAGFGTVTNAAGKWKRSGSDLEVFVSCTTGTTAAILATVSLPSGLSIDSSKLTINNTTSNPGNLVGTYNSSDAAVGGVGNVVLAPATSTSLFYFGSLDAGASSHITPTTVNGVVSASKVFSFYAKVPIQGWSSTPTLLALPISKENVFSGAISGSALIYKKSSDWINSASTGSTGIYTLDYTKLGLTAPPAITVTAESSDIYGSAPTITATSATIRMVNAAGTLVNAAFNIILQKQSPDYTAPGVFVGNVAKNQVAIVQYRGNGTRTTISSSGVAMPLSVVKGNTSIVTLKTGTNGQSAFELQAGEYDIECSPWIYLGNNFAGGAIYNFLYNVTDASEIDRGQPVENATGASILTSFHPKMVANIAITSAKTFEYKLQGSSGIASAFIGDSLASPNDLGGYCKIVKLNGQ